MPRTSMATATAFITVNIWTGCPLIALWVGSQVVGERRVTMTAIFVIVVVGVVGHQTNNVFSNVSNGLNA